MRIADLLSSGTDTARVEKMREVLADHYKQRDSIQQCYSDILKLAENDPVKYGEELKNQLQANARLRRVTINRFSTVLSEDWAP